MDRLRLERFSLCFLLFFFLLIRHSALTVLLLHSGRNLPQHASVALFISRLFTGYSICEMTQKCIFIHSGMQGAGTVSSPLPAHTQEGREAETPAFVIPQSSTFLNIFFRSRHGLGPKAINVMPLSLTKHYVPILISLIWNNGSPLCI